MVVAPADVVDEDHERTSGVRNGFTRRRHAWTEAGDPAIGTVKTRVKQHNGRWVLNGEKYYSTGSIFADWIDVFARREDDSDVIVAVATERFSNVSVTSA